MPLVSWRACVWEQGTQTLASAYPLPHPTRHITSYLEYLWDPEHCVSLSRHASYTCPEASDRPLVSWRACDREQGTQTLASAFLLTTHP